MKNILYKFFIVLLTIITSNSYGQPTVSTTAPVVTGSYTTTCGGTVSSGGPLTAEGVCWNTTGNPTILDQHTIDGTLVGTYTSYITGLAANQLYHVRAYATNSLGTGYGNDLTFTTCSAYTLPYFEGFEGIIPPAWPCGWTLSYPGNPVTYSGAGHTGNNYFYFYYSPAGSQWVFTPGLNLSGGTQYLFSMWYRTDGYNGWDTLRAAYGTTPTISAMSPINGAIVLHPINTTYQQLIGAFTPSINGIYFIGICCEHTTVPYYLSVDDINLSVLVGNGRLSEKIPDVFELSQNYPNPFNPSTIISYQLPVTNHVKLIIYDILGREIYILVNEKQIAGYYQVEWDASNYPSGVYFYKLVTEKFIDTKRMILLK